MGRVIGGVVAAVAAGFVALGAPDIARYLRMRKMSAGRERSSANDPRRR